MDAVFKKMNFKDYKIIVVINAPQSFETNIAAMEGLTTFAREFKTASETDFILAFCTKQSEVDAVALEASKILRG
jgi:aryl-alcohol dehydrogenase-like predicted oxidoreductase